MAEKYFCAVPLGIRSRKSGQRPSRRIRRQKILHVVIVLREDYLIVEILCNPGKAFVRRVARKNLTESRCVCPPTETALHGPELLPRTSDGRLTSRLISRD